jgi:hypothetical protein
MGQTDPQIELSFAGRCGHFLRVREPIAKHGDNIEDERLAKYAVTIRSRRIGLNWVSTRFMDHFVKIVMALPRACASTGKISAWYIQDMINGQRDVRETEGISHCNH